MADYTAPLASLSITHVFYDPTDPISLLCAYLALIPQGLVVVYATLVLTTREAEIGLTFAGQLACEAVNFVLKRLIKEERPRRIHGKGYGMPSSHAQFVFFWCVYVALFLLVRHKPAKRAWSVAERSLASVAAVGVAAAVAWSRVYLNYHTTKQVLVGSAAGTVFAIVWFVVVGVVRQIGLLDWALELPIVRALRVRDLAVTEDITQAGWDKWEAKRAATKKNKTK